LPGEVVKEGAKWIVQVAHQDSSSRSAGS